jgi:hypothetical protein
MHHGLHAAHVIRVVPFTERMRSRTAWPLGGRPVWTGKRASTAAAYFLAIGCRGSVVPVQCSLLGALLSTGMAAAVRSATKVGIAAHVIVLGTA